MRKIQPITFEIWAGLMAGRISYVSERGADLKYDRPNRTFIMKRGYGRGIYETHTLAADLTNHERLDAHWKGFCNGERA